jgi:hypothetical protein
MRMRFVLLLLIGIMLVAGCQASSKPLDQARKPDQAVEPTDSGYPAEVRNWLSNMKPYLVAGVIERGGKTYLLVSGGEQRTAGYEVKISDVTESDDQLTVYVDMTNPGGPAAQVLSYPNAVYVMDRSIDDDKKVVFVKAADQERIPQIVGHQPTVPFMEGSHTIKIMEMELDDGEIEVEGIALVDDGTVHYRLTNASGNVMSSGRTSTEAQAPDWGCFELDDVEFPADATHLELYRIDPRDQSPQDMVRVPL